MDSEKKTGMIGELDGSSEERIKGAEEETGSLTLEKYRKDQRQRDGFCEKSDEIDRQIQAMMTVDPSDDGKNGKTKKKRKKKAVDANSVSAGKKPKLIQRVKGWSRKRKVITTVCALAVIAFLGSKLTGGKKEMGLPVTVLPLTKQSIQEKLTLNGPVSGTDSVDVVSNIHAEITEIHIKEGDQVQKDQILAVLDSTDLEREVQIAQNAYDLAVNNKKEKDKEAALGYEKAVQDFHKASMDHNRNNLLFANGDISQMDLETSANTLDRKSVV